MNPCFSRATLTDIRTFDGDGRDDSLHGASCIGGCGVVDCEDVCLTRGESVRCIDASVLPRHFATIFYFSQSRTRGGKNREECVALLSVVTSPVNLSVGHGPRNSNH